MDARERWEDSTYPGENYLAGTRYLKGTPLTGATGQTFLGSQAEWLGQGTDLSEPGRPLDGQGLPLACQVPPGSIPAGVLLGVEVSADVGSIPAPGQVVADVAIAIAVEGDVGNDYAFPGAITITVDLVGTVEHSYAFHAPMQVGVDFVATFGSKAPVPDTDLGVELGFDPFIDLQEPLDVEVAIDLDFVGSLKSQPGLWAQPVVDLDFVLHLLSTPPIQAVPSIRLDFVGNPAFGPFSAGKLSARLDFVGNLSTKGPVVSLGFPPEPDVG